MLLSDEELEEVKAALERNRQFLKEHAYLRWEHQQETLNSKETMENEERSDLQINVGDIYKEVEGAETNPSLAIEKFIHAAEQGDIHAMNNLTVIYGCDKSFFDYAKAIKWFHVLLEHENDPQSPDYQKTGYNKALCENIINIIDNALSENDVPNLLKSCYSTENNAKSLFSKPLFFASVQTKEHVVAIRAIENERKERERIEKERLEQERLEKERIERERLEKERQEKERIEREQREKERLERDKRNEERREKERIKREQEKKERLERERQTQIKQIESGTEWDKSSYFTSFAGHLEIPDGTTKIGHKAFLNCRKITSISMPDSVTEIDYNAFENCSGLTSISLSKNITKIGSGAFIGCTSLKSVIIPNGITKIEQRVFEKCHSLQSVIIPDSVTSIETCAFYDCKSLISLTIPQNMELILDNAFYGCTSLTSIEWNAINCGIKEHQYHQYGDSDFLFQCLDKLSSFIIGEKVIYIPSYLCYNLPKLTSIIFPEGLTTIGYCAFKSCVNLTSISLPTSIKRFGVKEKVITHNIPINGSYVEYRKSVYFNTETKQIIVPAGTKEDFLLVDGFQDCNYYNKITEKEPSTEQERKEVEKKRLERARKQKEEQERLKKEREEKERIERERKEKAKFTRELKKINSEYIKQLIESDYLDNSPFKDLKGYYGIPYNVKKIGRAAFKECAGLTSITVTNSVTSISAAAFEGCSGLTSVVIGDNVTNIGESAFMGCNNLTSISFGERVAKIENSAFKGCKKLKSVSIPSSLSSIGNNAFDSSLEQMIVPNLSKGKFQKMIEGKSGLQHLTDKIIEEWRAKLKSIF